MASVYTFDARDTVAIVGEAWRRSFCRTWHDGDGVWHRGLVILRRPYHGATNRIGRRWLIFDPIDTNRDAALAMCETAKGAKGWIDARIESFGQRENAVAPAEPDGWAKLMASLRGRTIGELHEMLEAISEEFRLRDYEPAERCDAQEKGGA